MNDYEIKIFQNEQQVSTGFGQGASACEALENSIRQGSTFIPSGNADCLALVLSMPTGLVFKFEFCRAF